MRRCVFHRVRVGNVCMKKSRRMTEQELQVLMGKTQPKQPEPAKSKYGNKRVEFEGATFDSKRELAWWLDLKLQERAGLISDLQRQVPFVLAPEADLGGPRKKPHLLYIADAVYRDNQTGERVVADCKGCITDVYRIKKHLMFTVHGILIKEVK
jgi:hypothetical protein